MEVKPLSVEELRNIVQRVSNDTLLAGLKLIINGHLLLQGHEIDPDHPNYNRRMIVVIFETDAKISEPVKKTLIARYADSGWSLEFGQDWRSGGPWIICRIKDPGTQEARMAKITTKFRELGHNMSEWCEENGRYFCKCNNHSCQLEVMFSMRQGGAVYFADQFPAQDYYKCPVVAMDI